MKFSNLKIGTRLSLNVAVTSLLMIFLATLGISYLSQLKGNIGDVYASEERSQLATELVGLTATSFANFRTLTNTKNPQLQQRMIEQIAQSNKRDDQIFASLKKEVVSAQGQALLADLYAKQKPYRDFRAKAEGLIAKGDDASVQQAMEITENEGLSALNAFNDTVKKLNNYENSRADQAKSTAERMTTLATETMIVISAIAVILGVILSWISSRSITRPIAHGVRVAETVASGDLTQRIEAQSKDETGQLLRALREMNDSLARAVSHIRQGAETISSASNQIAAGNTDLSARTEQQAASLEETAASMEEMASTVKQNAENARQANQLASSASDVAERGGAAVTKVVATMSAISTSSNKISEIVSVIDGIAFQTNILALNAAVEAARAGEQGKGFAVVAGEVRTLAQRSASAAKEIKELIEDSVGKVTVGATQAQYAGATMQEVVTSVKRVTDIMGEISAASDEQARGVDQVNTAISQMDEVTQQNAALVEEAAAAAGAMQDQAIELVRAVATFKTGNHQIIEAASMSHAAVGNSPSMEPFAKKPARPSTRTAPRLGNRYKTQDVSESAEIAASDDIDMRLSA